MTKKPEKQAEKQAASLAGNPTITVSAGVTGGLTASPTTLETSGVVDMINNSGANIYYIFSTTTTWPTSGSGTQIGTSPNNTGSTTVGETGYILFGTSAAGPSMTNTRVTKTGTEKKPK